MEPTNRKRSMLVTSTEYVSGSRKAPRVSIEPGIGADAPQPPMDNEMDIEEAMDDVEFPETVILVGKSHWRCVCCIEQYPRASSIDDHLMTCHSQQAAPVVVNPATKRGRRRGRGLSQSQKIHHVPTDTIEPKHARSSQRTRQSPERDRLTQVQSLSGRGRGRPKLQGRGSRGSRGRRGRGGRGRGRVFTKPLSSEDSDTELDDATAPSSPVRTQGKRKSKASLDLKVEDQSEANQEQDDLPAESKIPRNYEDFTVLSGDTRNEGSPVPSSDGQQAESLPPSPLPVARKTTKEAMKEKYAIIIKRAGAADSPSQYDPHIDIDPSIAIVTPSLQADALLAPATPFLPDLNGALETPIPPDTPQQHDPFHHPQTLDPVEPQLLVSSNPHESPSPGTAGIFELQEHLLQHQHTTARSSEHRGDLDTIKHTCKTCAAELEGTLCDLMNHYHTDHNQYICTQCYELFANESDYEDHRMVHAPLGGEVNAAPVVYACPVRDCFQLCDHKELLMDHISWHEDLDLEEEQLHLVACTYCPQHFRHKVALERHLVETHGQPGLEPFVCELCQEGFSRNLDLDRHNSLLHAGVERYGCAYCDQRFG